MRDFPEPVGRFTNTSCFWMTNFWKAAKLSSSLCLTVLGVLKDGCYNKANCPRGNKTSG